MFGARAGRLSGADWPHQWFGQFHRCPRAAAKVFFSPPPQGDAFSASPSSKLDFRRCTNRPKNTLAACRQSRSVLGRRFRSARSGAGSRGSIPGAIFRARFCRPRPAGDPLHTRPRVFRRRCNCGGIAGAAEPRRRSQQLPRARGGRQPLRPLGAVRAGLWQPARRRARPGVRVPLVLKLTPACVATPRVCSGLVPSSSFRHFR